MNHKSNTKDRISLGVSKEVAEIDLLTPRALAILGENGIKSLDNLADLASDELLELVGNDNLDQDRANQVIMAARAHWFETDTQARA